MSAAIGSIPEWGFAFATERKAVARLMINSNFMMDESCDYGFLLTRTWEPDINDRRESPRKERTLENGKLTLPEGKI